MKEHPCLGFRFMIHENNKVTICAALTMGAVAPSAWPFQQAECVLVLIINFWMKMELLAHLILKK